MATLIDFINNPDNTRVLYLIAGVLFAFGIMLIVLLRRGASGAVHIGGNNAGIVNTGTVKGDVRIGDQSQPSKRNWFVIALDLGAKLTAILGFLLALWVFILSQSNA